MTLAAAGIAADEMGKLREWRALWIGILVFAALATAAAIRSRGFAEGDAVTHYLYARFAFHEPYLFVDVWGRPFVTGIYSVPAVLGGRLGVRLASVAMAIAVGLLCFRVARKQKYRHPALAAIFVFAQPVLFMHAFSELTELPFMLLVALTLVAYQERKWHWLALVVGLMPTARPEGFGFIVLTAIALVAHALSAARGNADKRGVLRCLSALPLLVVPLLIWTFAGWHVHGRPGHWYIDGFLWLKQHWPYSGDSVYGKKNFFFLMVMLPGVIGPMMFVALPFGIWRSLRERPVDHRRQVQWIIALLPLSVLLGHSTISALGKMGSDAELRYLITVSPMWALLLALGWEWLFEHLRWRPVFLAAGAAALVPILVNYKMYQIVPVRMSKEGLRAEQQVVPWFEASAELRKSYPRLMVTARDLNYFLDMSPTDHDTAAEWKRETIEKDQNGIMLIWDPVYGQYNSDRERVISAPEIEQLGWIPIKIFDVQPGEDRPLTSMEQMARKINKDDLGDWLVFLSPNDKDGRPTMPPQRVELPTTRRIGTTEQRRE